MEGKKLKIRVFTGKQDDWSLWRIKFEALMDDEDLLDSLEEGPPTAPATTETTADAPAPDGTAAAKWKKRQFARFFLSSFFTPREKLLHSFRVSRTVGMAMAHGNS